MCCLISIAGMLGPRLAILVWYLVNPLRWRATFDTWVWPLLGSLFLPWTTLAYVVVMRNGNIDGLLEWLLILVGVLFDLSSHGGGVRSRKRRRQD
jgi:hypothetical protein